MKAAAANAGFTLVELVITLSLVSIALLAIIYGWSLSAQHSADATWQAKTAYIGQTYLEEILTKRFDEQSSVDGSFPCGSGLFQGVAMPACSAASAFGTVDGESRNAFDDVDDYHNLDEAPMVLLDALYTGNVNPYGAYRVTVVVSYDTSLVATANMVKRVQVTVTPPGQSPVRFSAYKGNY
ncbi:MAG: type IV pilus modification PilV family protein [Pontibacterium sp.]